MKEREALGPSAEGTAKTQEEAPVEGVTVGPPSD